MVFIVGFTAVLANFGDNFRGFLTDENDLYNNSTILIIVAVQNVFIYSALVICILISDPKDFTQLKNKDYHGFVLIWICQFTILICVILEIFLHLFNDKQDKNLNKVP
eukprot:UN13485